MVILVMFSNNTENTGTDIRMLNTYVNACAYTFSFETLITMMYRQRKIMDDFINNMT